MCLIQCQLYYDKFISSRIMFATMIHASYHFEISRSLTCSLFDIRYLVMNDIYSLISRKKNVAHVLLAKQRGRILFPLSNRVFLTAPLWVFPGYLHIAFPSSWALPTHLTLSFIHSTSNDYHFPQIP